MRPRRGLGHAAVSSLQSEFVVNDLFLFEQLLDEGGPLLRVFIDVKHRGADELLAGVSESLNRWAELEDGARQLGLVVDVLDVLEDVAILRLAFLQRLFRRLALRDVERGSEYGRLALDPERTGGEVDPTLATVLRH